MDGMFDDPELAQEILKLLHTKLRDAQQELQDLRRAVIPPKSEVALLDSTELQRQNEELSDELTSLQLRLSAAAEREDSKENIHEASPHDEELHARLLALQARQAAAEADIEQKKLQLKKYKAKYRQLRADNATLDESISELPGEIKHRTKEIADCEAHIKTAEAELCSLGPPIPEVPQKFDVEEFISARIRKLGLPELASFQCILRSTPLLELPHEILNKFGPMELLVLAPEEVMWSKGSIDRAVLITQPYRYDPTAKGNTGSWEANPSLGDLMDGIGRQRELFIRKKDDCHYYGTYQCVGYSSLSTEASKDLTASVVRHALNATATHKDHLAPLSLKFIESLYADGLLELQCFAFERTNFHHKFNEALLSSAKAIQTINSLAAKRCQTAASVVRKLQPHSEGAKRERSGPASSRRSDSEDRTKKQKRS